MVYGLWSMVVGRITHGDERGHSATDLHRKTRSAPRRTTVSHGPSLAPMPSSQTLRPKATTRNGESETREDRAIHRIGILRPVGDRVRHSRAGCRTIPGQAHRR